MTRLLLLFLCAGIPAQTSCLRVDGHSCVSSYWDTVTCLLNITDRPGGKSNYSLSFLNVKNNGSKSCPLAVKNLSYSCVCKITEGPYLYFNEKYTIKLCHESGCHLVRENFQPSQSIQLRPPHRAEVRQTPEIFNITWESGYEDHQFFSKALKYELLVQTSHSKDSKTISPNGNQKFLSYPRSELKADAKYCVKVRSHTDISGYNGIWSEWSPSTCWKDDAGEEGNNISIILNKSLIPLIISVGVLVLVFCSPAVRMKIKSLSHMPSPAPFFKPLFEQHDGNLQEWVSPQGKFQPVYKMEEILTTSAVIIEPKPVTMEPEEIRDFHSSSVIPLEFPQCQTTYVGLPGLLVVSPPLVMDFPVDMSYTQWPPCSILGVDPVEVEDVSSSPPKDLPIFTRADSGCSGKDLTQSPECSIPNSPVVDSPPPSNNTDYYILNKTAQGFVPVMVSKGSSPKMNSDSLQED